MKDKETLSAKERVVYYSESDLRLVRRGTNR